MGVLFMGAEAEDFAILNAAAGTNNGNGDFSAAFARSYLQNTSGGGFASAPLAAASTELWAHMVPGVTPTVSQRSLMFCKSGGNVANERIGLKTAAASQVLQIVKFDGTTETVLASSASSSFPTPAWQYWDLYVRLGASAIVTGYVNGTQVVTWTGDLSALTSDVDWVRFCQTRMSEMFAHTEDTRGMRLQLRAPNAAGDSNTFTAGTFTAVDEVIADLTDTVNSATAAQVSQMKFPALPTAPGGGWAVRARKSTILAIKGLDAGPSSLDFGEKTNGTAYYPTTVACLNAFTAATLTEEVNPATGVRYTPAEALAIQLSLRSA